MLVSVQRKQRVAMWLRDKGLLRGADYLLFGRNLATHFRDNLRFRQENPEWVPPPVDLAYDAYNHTNYRIIHDGGLEHARKIHSLFMEGFVGEDANQPKSILEWGCGPARVLRHLPHMPGFETSKFFGSDYNPKTVRWCQNNIPNIEFRQNSLMPPLPFAEDSFDGIYNISVFTHLSREAHFGWMAELKRVLKPGGVLIVTTHGSDLAKDRLFGEEEKLFSAGQLVVRGKITEGKKHFLAYHPERFVKEDMLSGFSILKHIPSQDPQSLGQDVWVAKLERS